MQDDSTYVCFADSRRLAQGPLETVLRAAKLALDGNARERLLLFEEATGQQVDFDFSGTIEQVLSRARPAPVRAGPGRPRLGVVSREISLLPRHWEWLEQQPQGASAALRRLVDAARKQDPDGERARRCRDAISRVMWTMAGNLPGFEEASRALFAADADRFQKQIRAWPEDLRDYLLTRLRETGPLCSPQTVDGAETS